MLNGKKIICVIPARLESQRFPRKVLTNLLGKPMLEWVWRSAKKNKVFDDIVFAVDAEVTADLVSSFGANYVMTSPTCPSGTDRIVEIVKRNIFQADIWVNWQGDEPFIIPQMINDLLQKIDVTCDVWTLKKIIINEEDILSHSTVKVVSRLDGSALYFSRQSIPFYRDSKNCKKIYFQHIGIYAYTTQALLKIAQAQVSPLEKAEQLEQLRFLEMGLRINVNQTSGDVVEINYPSDLAKAEQFARQNFIL